VRARDAAGNWSLPVSTTLTVTAAALFNDSFGSGNFNAWSSNTGGPNVVVTAAASLAGAPAFGMRVTLGGSSTARYAQDDTPNSETTYHAAFSFNPHGATTANAEHDIFVGLDAAATPAFRVQFRKNGSNYQVRAIVRRAGGQQSTSWYTITNATHTIDVKWTSAASAEFRLSIDNSLKQKLINLDTSGIVLDAVRLGAVAGLKTAMSGTEYFDGFTSNR
jgi:hypothetical protein